VAQIELKSIALNNGETLGYREREGGDETVLLIHGNMISSKHWDVVMENMDEKYKVIAVDLRGFGISTYHQSIETLRDFSNDVKLFVDALEFKDFTLVGWSMGGGVAMYFAADYPGYANKLILLASLSTRGFPFLGSTEPDKSSERLQSRAEIAADLTKAIPLTTAYQSRDKNLLRALWNKVIYTHNQPSEERYEAYLEDMFTQRPRCLVDVYHANNIFNISHVNNGLVDGTGEVDHIQIPTLILWGRNEVVVPEQTVLDIQSDIGDNAEIIYLDHCGHSPLVDDPDQLLQRMTEFIESN
jgi:pimeloyl-ACP methyl ester carboxylesterase